MLRLHLDFFNYEESILRAYFLTITYMQIFHTYMVASPLFPLGETVITTGANEYLIESGIDPVMLLARHQSGDWSQMLPESQEENKEALEK